MPMQSQRGGRVLSNLLNPDTRRGWVVNAMAQQPLHPNEIAPAGISEARWAPGPFS